MLRSQFNQIKAEGVPTALLPCTLGDVMETPMVQRDSVRADGFDSVWSDLWLVSLGSKGDHRDLTMVEQKEKERRGSWWPGGPCYLLVALQLLGEGALVEEELQALLGVVVAQLLKGGPSALPHHLGVLCPRGVHHRH